MVLGLVTALSHAPMTYLVSRGIAQSCVTLVRYGEERPGCTAYDEACWAQNRRAHFSVKRQ
jgi:peptidoglycan-associated lipoprotein